ncbi:PQQ-binding-like beta-propeller repeat protein [Streptomyces sp. MS19]|uniref:outer membrane protein assembly factor BamB family protein n=1 Tax=Streptomyces sp. MS19 TaxID=3385972 RepID=UPI0039A28C3F
MSDGEGRIGLVATVGVLLFGLLTVLVVISTRQDATDTADPGELVSDAGATLPQTAPPAALGRIWQTPAAPTGAATDGGGPSTDTADPAPPIRLWAHDATLATVAPSGVSGYGSLDGTRLWTADAPPDAGPLCAAGDGVSASGVGAVLRTAEGGGCAYLSVIDIDTGTTLWSADLTDPDPAPGARPADPADVTVTAGDQTVTVNLDAAGTPAAFHRFDATTGTVLPPPAPPADEPLCPEDAEPQALHHAGSRIVELTRCAGTGDLLLNAYAADTGELEWTHPADDPAFTFSGVAAGDPVLLRQGSQLVAYAETGDELWRMAEPDRSLVTGTVLSVQDGPPAAGLVPLAGYDLATGRRLWTDDAEAGTQFFGEDDRGALLTGRVTGDALWLESRDPDTGAATPGPIAELPAHRVDDRLAVAYDEYQLYVLATVETDEGPALRLRAYER